MLDNIKYAASCIWNDKVLRNLLLASLIIVLIMIVSVSVSNAETPKPTVTLIKKSTTVCIDKIIPNNPKKRNKGHIKQVQQCIEKQINSAYIIKKIYLDKVDTLQEGPTKHILQVIVVDCNKENASMIFDEKHIDYDLTLQCIHSSLDGLNESLDEAMLKLKKKKGNAI